MFLKCPNRFVTGHAIAIAASIPLLNAGFSSAHEMPLAEPPQTWEMLGNETPHASAELKPSSASVEAIAADPAAAKPSPGALPWPMTADADTPDAEPAAVPPTATHLASCAVAACLALVTTDESVSPLALSTDATAVPTSEASPTLAQTASDAGECLFAGVLERYQAGGGRQLDPTGSAHATVSITR